MTSLAHWVFACKYFEVALNTHLLLRLESTENASKKQRCHRLTVNALHLIYVAVLLVVLAYSMTVILVKDDIYKGQDIFNQGNISTRAFTALLLLVSICIINAQVRKYGKGKLSMRDWLMRIHACCFSAMLAFAIVAAILELMAGSSESGL